MVGNICNGKSLSIGTLFRKNVYYSKRTEQDYLNWARRFILFHDKRHPQDMGLQDVEAFLTKLRERLQKALADNHRIEIR